MVPGVPEYKMFWIFFENLQGFVYRIHTRIRNGSQLYRKSLRNHGCHLCVPVTKRPCACVSILTSNLNINLQKPGRQRTDLQSVGSVFEGFTVLSVGNGVEQTWGQLKACGKLFIKLAQKPLGPKL